MLKNKVLEAQSPEKLEAKINQWFSEEHARPSITSTFKIVNMAYSTHELSYSALFLYYEAS